MFYFKAVRMQNGCTRKSSKRLNVIVNKSSLKETAYYYTTYMRV